MADGPTPAWEILLGSAGSAIGQVVWWWLWYGIVYAILDNRWGFGAVTLAVFLIEIFKREREAKP